jgi:hypothetical protein
MQGINKQEGITLLITLLIMGVLFGISTSLLNVTMKQYQLSGIAFASETAFQAANAGIECALYHDFPQNATSIFDVPGDGTEQLVSPTMICMNQGAVVVQDLPNPPFPDLNPGNSKSYSGGEQRFQFNWPGGPATPIACVEVSVYKFFSTGGNVARTVNGVSYGADCAKDTVCTILQSRGYNVPCADINASPRVVEREFTQVY